MSGEKPELMALVWKLYKLAMQLAEELEEPGLDEKERRWKFDALSKVTSPLVRLLEIAAREGEVDEEDLVRLLSGLGDHGLMSRMALNVTHDSFERSRRFLRACLEYARRRNNEELVREFERLLEEVDRLEVKIKCIYQAINRDARKGSRPREAGEA